jgi:hypothetical protein
VTTSVLREQRSREEQGRDDEREPGKGLHVGKPPKNHRAIRGPEARAAARRQVPFVSVISRAVLESGIRFSDLGVCQNVTEK